MASADGDTPARSIRACRAAAKPVEAVTQSVPSTEAVVDLARSRGFCCGEAAVTPSKAVVLVTDTVTGTPHTYPTARGSFDFRPPGEVHGDVGDKVEMVGQHRVDG